MFRKELIRRLELIFGMKKTTMDAPSDEFEQDTLFVEVTFANSRISGKGGGRQTARVVGKLTVFSQDNKMPFGFFSKQIEQSMGELTRPFNFYDIDIDDPTSQARLQNIHERSISFVFLYDSQYDPDKGELTSLETTVTNI